MRKNRFRYSKFTPQEFAGFCLRSSRVMQRLYKQRVENFLTAPEFVASYLLCLQIVSQPKRVLGPRLAKPLVAIESATPSLVDNLQKMLADLELSNLLSGRLAEAAALSPLEVFNQYSVVSVPIAVNQALGQWQLGRYHLDLHFEMLSAEQVLALQARGRRLVTVFVDEGGALNHFHNHRDPFSFTLHDLVHADLFFKNQTEHQQQVHFFKNLEAWLKNEQVQEALHTHPELKTKVDYLSSDMNTHPAHLHAYLSHLAQEHSLHLS